MRHNISSMRKLQNKKKYTLCIHKNCIKYCSFNYVNEIKPLYCTAHKLENMIDIKCRRCIHTNCTKQAYCNYYGESKYLYCNEHKLDTMTNVKTPRCLHVDCMKFPLYNYKGKRAIYCKDHKSSIMINVHHKRCIYEECDKHASYNYIEQNTPLYCFTHKLEIMINITRMRNKNAKINNAQAKLMENNASTTTTTTNNHNDESVCSYCSITSTYTNCIECNDNSAITTYDNYCLQCYVTLFPYTKISQYYKKKEMTVMYYISTIYPNFTWKCINNNTKPYYCLNLGFRTIILEVDENHHISYDIMCQNKRTLQLSQNVQYTPLVIIRFNPNEYDNNSSCWYEYLYTCEIKEIKRKEWQDRLLYLQEIILYYSQEQTKLIFTTVMHYLFFDTEDTL